MNNKHSKQNGFSLTEVLIAAALMGGLSIVFMQQVKNISNSKRDSQSTQDEVEILRTIRMIIDDERYCRISIAGKKLNGSAAKNPDDTDIEPITFNKTAIDNEGSEVTKASDFTPLSDGLNVELWFSNQDGDKRTIKKFNGEDNIDGEDKSRYGNITIKSIKLVLYNGTTDYPGGPGDGREFTNDPAQLVILMNKKVGNNKTRDFKEIISLKVSGKTKNSGTKRSTLYSCISSEGSASSHAGLYPGNICPPNTTVSRMYYRPYTCPGGNCQGRTATCTTTAGWFASAPSCTFRARIGTGDTSDGRDICDRTRGRTLSCSAPVAFIECQ